MASLLEDKSIASIKNSPFLDGKCINEISYYINSLKILIKARNG